MKILIKSPNRLLTVIVSCAIFLIAIKYSNVTTAWNSLSWLVFGISVLGEMFLIILISSILSGISKKSRFDKIIYIASILIICLIYLAQIIALKNGKTYLSVLAMESFTEGRYVKFTVFDYVIFSLLFSLLLAALFLEAKVVRGEIKAPYEKITDSLQIFFIFFFVFNFCVNLKSDHNTDEIKSYKTPIFSFIKNINISAGTYLCETKDFLCEVNDVESYKFLRSEVSYADAKKYSICKIGDQDIFLIFVEGFSRSLLDYRTEKYGELMPNIKKIYEKSLAFERYYNHTAATYRGIKGQFYSAYSEVGGSMEGRGWEESDNAKILASVRNISVIDILNSEGYESNFYVPLANVHPFNILLKKIGFSNLYTIDKLISDVNFPRAINLHSKDEYLNDTEFFELISDKILKNAEYGGVKIHGIYNTGTHAFLDTKQREIGYGDGVNEVLNRFHNFDKVFGDFYFKIRSSGKKFKNALFFITADHSTYPDDSFKSVMNDLVPKYFVDSIPLIINGPCIINEAKIDVNGGNSLGFAPTLLNILDAPNKKNNFLGSSLFNRDFDEKMYLTSIGNQYFSTANGRVKSEAEMSPDELSSLSSLRQQVLDYYTLERQNRLYPLKN